MDQGPNIKMMQELVMAASGVTLAAFILVVLQAIYVYRLTHHYRMMQRLVHVLLHSRKEDQRRRFELYHLDVEKQIIEDRIDKIRDHVDRMIPLYHKQQENSFTGLPDPPTTEELSEIQRLICVEAKNLTRSESGGDRAACVRFGGKLTIRDSVTQSLKGEAELVRGAIGADGAEARPKGPSPTPPHMRTTEEGKRSGGLRGEALRAVAEEGGVS